jgi:hypothetical protein
MLVIDGLSPNLSATDFYRITPNDLSDWQSVIRKGMVVAGLSRFHSLPDQTN